jgi:hypothetical protein
MAKDKNLKNQQEIDRAHTAALKTNIKIAEKYNSILQARSLIETQIELSRDRVYAAQSKEIQALQKLADIEESRASFIDGMASNQQKLAQLKNKEIQKNQQLLTINNAKVAAEEAALEANKRINLALNQTYQQDLLIAKLSDQRAQVEEDIAGFILQQRLDKEAQLDPDKKLLESMKKQAERQKEVDEFFGKYKEKWDDFVDTIQDPKVAGGLFLISLTNEIENFASTLDTMGESMQLSKTQAISMSDELLGANLQGSIFGITAAQNAAAMQGLVEGTGNLRDVTSDTVVEISKIAKETGLSELAAGKLVGQMSLLEGSSTKQSKKTLETVAALARGAKVPIAKVMNDVAENMELTSKFAKTSTKELGAMAVNAAKAGTSLSELSSMGDALMDIDSARAKAMELSVLTGRQIRVDKAQQLVYEGKIVEAQQEMLKQVGGVAGWSQMDYFAKRDAAALVGSTVADLEKQLNMSEGITETGEEQASNTEKTLSYFKTMGGYLKENAGFLSSSLNLVGAMGKGLASFSPAIGKFGSKITDKLKDTGVGRFLGHGPVQEAATDAAEDVKGDAIDAGKDKVKEVLGTSDEVGEGDSKGGIKKKMQDLAAGLRAMGKGTFKGILALALAGPALVVALPSIPFLLFMGMTPLAALSTNLTSLAKGLKALGKGTLMGVLALALAGPALALALPSIPFLMIMGLVPLGMLAMNFQSLATGLKALGKGTLMGVLALALAGPALALALPSIPFLMIMGLVPLAMLAVNFQSLATGLKALGKGTLMGVLALALAGPALALALPSIPFLMIMGLVPLGMLAMNFQSLATGLKSLGKGFGTILKGLLVLGLLGVAMIPAAYAFSLLSGVDAGAMLAFSVSLGILGLAAAGLGFIFPMVLLGSLALAVLGVAIIPAALAMGNLKGIDPAVIIGFGVGLTLIAAAVAGMGLMIVPIALGAVAAHLLGFAIKPAAAALSGLGGIDPATIIGFGIGLAAIAAAVAGMGLMIVPIALGAIAAQLLGFAIEPAVAALSGLGGIDAESIIGFGIGLAVIAASVAGMGMLLPSIVLGVLGMIAISAALPSYALALGMIPKDLDMIGFAAGTAALGVAGMVLIPGAIGFALMAGALTLFAASLLLLVPLMPVMDKLGSLGLGIGEKGGGGGEKSDSSAKGSSEIIKKLDELIVVIKQGGKVMLDGKEVGKIVQLASGPIGS